MLLIHADNYCDVELDFVEGLPTTTKDDRKNHGYGMTSIRYIVTKYQGTLAVTAQDKRFAVNILLPLE